MTGRPTLFLTGTVLLQAIYLMVVGHIMRCGAIEWRLFGHLLLMGLGFTVVFLPFFGWLYKKRRGRRMPWSTALIFITFFFSVALGGYYWPHTSSEEESRRKYLLVLCLYFTMAAPISTFGMRRGNDVETR